MNRITYDTDFDKYKQYKSRRNLWSDALKSGEYKQGFAALVNTSHGRLTENREYCCLGVACEVFGKQFGFEVDYLGSYFVNEDRTEVASLILPESLRAYLGLSITDQKILTTLNDHFVPFETIALVIDTMDIVEE